MGTYIYLEGMVDLRDGVSADDWDTAITGHPCPTGTGQGIVETALDDWGGCPDNHNGRWTIEFSYSNKWHEELDGVIAAIAPMVAAGETLAYECEGSRGRYRFTGVAARDEAPYEVWPDDEQVKGVCDAVDRALEDGSLPADHPGIESVLSLLRGMSGQGAAAWRNRLVTAPARVPAAAAS